MKTKKIRYAILTVITVIFISSCNKDEGFNSNYLDEITGTYTGEFNTNSLKSGTIGITNVTKINGDQLQIHCYGEIIDTTFIMDVFENGDSIMLCNTGIDFYNEYGHMGSGSHMMDMGTNQTEWMYHMQNEHHVGDEHYGSFDIKNHTFHYSFKMMDNDFFYKLGFDGIKHN